MPIYVIEVAIECDNVKEDALVALGLMAEAVGIDVESDEVELTVGSTDQERPVLIASLVASEPGEKDPNASES
jgi:hypothetical protein